MERIAQLLRNMSDARDEDIDLFLSLHEVASYNKGDYLLKAGQVERYLYFIKSGILRCFIVKEKKEDIKEITVNLVFPNWFFSAYDSFITQTPCKYTVECITDVEIYRISFDNLQFIYKNTGFGEKVGRVAVEQLFLSRFKREMSLLLDSVDERYKNLLENYPNHIQEVPLKYIASYIGVTPQALSKIRKRIFKQ
jgi:CRP-like cAMP-binding protein